MKFLLRSALFLNALFYLAPALLLLVSPFATLYAALQLPQPQPPLYGQLLGVVLLGLSWLLMQATFRGALTVPVARTAGPVNLASAVLVGSWLVAFDLPVEGAGRLWLPLLAVMLGIFALVQLPVTRRVRLRELHEREAMLARGQETPVGGPYATPARAGGQAGRPHERPHDTDYEEYGAASAARSHPSPEFRREPVITPPPGYEPGTEVVTDPAPAVTPSVHHARQNPHS